MRKDPSQVMFDDITSDVPHADLKVMVHFGASVDTLSKAIIDRALALRAYPAYVRMTKLIALRHFTMQYMDYHESRLARRVIASELLEITCLPVQLRVATMNHLGEACDPDEEDIARAIWRDCVAFAKLHGCESDASPAMRHLEAVSC